jgi:hypothetical protein
MCAIKYDVSVDFICLSRLNEKLEKFDVVHGKQYPSMSYIAFDFGTPKIGVF